MQETLSHKVLLEGPQRGRERFIYWPLGAHGEHYVAVALSFRPEEDAND